MRVHDSQAYRKMDVANERIRRILELREILLSIQIGFSLVNAAVNNAAFTISHPSKVMLKIILNRLKPQAEKIIAEEQAGFRAGRSNTEQIFNLHILREKYVQHQQDLYHVFIDFKKAFDRV